MVRGVSLSKPSKLFPVLALPATAAREITDALVIFSMSVLANMLVADWGGLASYLDLAEFGAAKWVQ
jgi:hypothetical protein